MTTLRARLTALIVVAILVVVGLASWVGMLLIEGPTFDGLQNSNAMQIGTVLALQEGRDFSNSRANVESNPISYGFHREPAEGRLLPRFTRDLKAALIRNRLPSDVRVTTVPIDRGTPTASLRLQDGGWLVLPVAMPPPPPDISPALFGWIILIALGTTTVAVLAVYRLTAPLALVKKSVANVGPHGEISVLLETGSAELRATARAINSLSSRLKSAMESRMRLVAAAGHDLRTPMTRMRLRAEFLDDPDRDKWLADLDELDRIADSAIHLVREETEEESGEPIRLDRLLAEVVNELRDQCLTLQLVVQQPVFLRARPLALKRAFRNLCINAATHGRGGKVSQIVRGTMATITISDEGPGIPECLLKQAQEPFFRVDSSRSVRGGAGLGLAIASEIIRRNGGTLTLSNGPEKGLVQTVDLPLPSEAKALVVN